MATVSHYAMQSYPALYGDGNSQLTSNQYYVASNQQLSPMYDKTKKTWSQRLKITKSEKLPSPLSELPDYPQSALSRSMKYAEPWLYGTVRGIPAPQLHGQAIFTPFPSEVAVVVCSCPEYLNGSKKEIKKASVCKKCKGSRLPLAPIGGTVRIRPTSTPIIHTPRASAGTVRLPSHSTKSRPTILDPRNDPYDLMRRSRLVSPEPKQISIDKSLKLRAKSASPTRGRSRSRALRPEDIILNGNPSVHKNGSVSIRPHGTLRLKSERWLEGMEHDPGNRKSILHCNVNPYDLISSKSRTINEFSPEPDMFLPSPKSETGPKSIIVPSRSNVKAIAGQRISFGEASSRNTMSVQNGRDSVNASMIPRKSEPRLKHESKGIEHHTKIEPLKQLPEHVKPKRPPRRKQESSADEDAVDITDKSAKQSYELDLDKNQILTIPKPTINLQIITQDSSSPTSPSSQKGIKSILKRPSASTPTPNDTDSKNSDPHRLEKTANSTITNDDLKSKFIVKTADTFNAIEKDSPRGDPPVGSGSQFYLPLPQTRKKVQFMVENLIFHHESEDDAATKAIVGAIISNGNKEENAVFKRKDSKLQTAVTNNEGTSNDELAGRNESSPNSREHQKDFNLLQHEQDRNWSRVQSPSRLEIASDSDSYKESYMDDNNSNNSTATKTTTKNSSMNPKKNCLIVVSPPQKNGSHSLSPEHKETEQEAYREGNGMEDGSVQKSDRQHCTDSFKPDTTRSTSLMSPSPARRSKSLRRTHSARSNNTTTVLLNFNDTMALRIKNIRLDSRDIFAESSGCQLSPTTSSSSSWQSRLTTSGNHVNTSKSPLSPAKQKVKDSSLSSHASSTSSLQPPAQPATTILLSSSPDSKDNSKEALSPAAKNISTCKDDVNLGRNETQRHKKSRDFKSKDATTVLVVDSSDKVQPARPPRQGYKKLTWQTEIGSNGNVESEQQDYPTKDNGTSCASSSTSEGTSGANKENKLNGDSIIFNEDHDHMNVVVRNGSLISANQVQKQALPGRMMEKEKLLQAHNEILNGSRLFGVPVEKGAQRTVVRVAPFNKEGSEVHRLKISHAENSSPIAVSPKKTSILINGDNCYSTVNVSSDTPLYQSSVVVNNGISTISTETSKTALNTVTINVSSPSTPEEEFTFKNNKINTLLTLNNNLQTSDSSSSTLSPSSSSSGTASDGDSSSYSGSLKRGSTLITLDFDKPVSSRVLSEKDSLAHEKELVKILRNPVEAVKRNLIPHVCGKSDDSAISSATENISSSRSDIASVNKQQNNSFIGKLLEDPMLHQLAEGLENEIVVKLIENSLKRLKDSRQSLDTSGTKDNESMNKLIDLALQKVKEERMRLETRKRYEAVKEAAKAYQEEQHENGSISSGNSYGSASYDLFDFENNESDCYQSCSSEMTTEDDAHSTRSKFYQMLVDATLTEIEISTNNEDDHHYESIRLNCDPIYEEIGDVPPPLPLSPPPVDADSDKKATRSMFEGASKYDILSYLVDAKERGLVREEPYEYNFSNTSEIIVEEEIDTLAELNKNKTNDASSRISHLSVTSDSSEDISLTSSISEKLTQRRPTSEVERNDSGVGSETSKSSRSKYQNPTPSSIVSKNSPIHLCEDCDGTVETQITDSGVMYAPLVCRKCSKKRAERKEIIIEIVETEEKYGRDLLIILEEFCKPMLVAGLLTQEQLSAIFLNTEELLENSLALAEKMRDGLDIALEQGDDDLLTVNVGKILLEATPMLHSFETYCVRQGAASLLLANLEKDKELLRIFLRVSQMENAVLRRMNLNSFLMVPVQRVTKYPLLLARLYKVTPAHLESRPFLKQAQEKIELHLNHMNQEAKDVPTKLWRRISSSSPNRRSSSEIDLINIKLRKMAIDVLEWNHDEVRFAMEGKLLYTQPTDSNWKKARTIKLTPINVLLVTNGKPSSNYKPDKASADQLSFPKHTGVREASLLMVKEKCGRYTPIREPLYLDRCIVCTEADWDDYFEVHEISSKDTFIFKAEDGARTKHWYTQLQFHSQGMGAWRKRRNALANIMINGMLTRT